MRCSWHARCNINKYLFKLNVHSFVWLGIFMHTPHYEDPLSFNLEDLNYVPRCSLVVKPDPNTSTSYIDPIEHCTFPRVSSQCCSAREELHKLCDLDYTASNYMNKFVAMGSPLFCEHWTAICCSMSQRATLTVYSSFNTSTLIVHLVTI